MQSFSEDIAIIQSIPAVPSILDVICRTTGMGFAAVARVTEERWVACSVLDNIHFGMKAGSELVLETTICHEIRQVKRPVVIDHVDQDEVYRDHHTPRQYGFQSYISVPIFLPGGEFYGTLCAIDPKPALVNTPAVIGLFTLFAELIGFHIDTTRKLASSQAQLLIERQASELREQFIGVLGHDLRTPLGAITIGAALLKRSSLDNDQQEAVAMLQRSAVKMSGLIDDTMDFARGRLGGGITIESRSDIPFEKILRQVVEEARTLWPTRPIETHFENHESVHFDEKRLAQLFTNLLTNAMTHGTSTGPVRVSGVSRHGKFVLSVANAAPPIAPEVLSRLFEPFSRGGAQNYRQGLGLGLYISSEIAKSHGGTLEATSDTAETRFTFTMPSLTPPAE